MSVVSLKAPELEGVEKSKAEQIRNTFLPMAEKLEGFEKDYQEIRTEYDDSDVITPSLIAKAKRLRLDISKVRIETGKIKDEEKKQYRLAANAIQGVHNILVWAVTEKEDALKEIEKHYDRLEEEKKKALHEHRMELISPYVGEGFDRDLSQMEEDVWEAYLKLKKDDFEKAKKAEEEAIRRKAEEDRRKGLCFQNGFSFNGISYVSNGVTIDIDNDPEELTWDEYFENQLQIRDAEVKKREEEARERERIDNLKKGREFALRPYFHLIRAEDFDIVEMTDDEFTEVLASLKLRKKKEEEKKEAEKKKRLAAEKKAKREADKRKAAEEALAKKEEKERLEKEDLLQEGDDQKWLRVLNLIEEISLLEFDSELSRKLHIDTIGVLDKISEKIRGSFGIDKAEDDE